MADTPFSALPVATDTDTLEYAGLQNSLTVQIPPSAALAQTIRTLGYTPAPIDSPVFTGNPQAPTPADGDDDTSIATTEFVKNQDYVTALTAPVTSVFGRTGDVVAANGDYDVSEVTGAAPLASPTFTGDPKAPTPAPGDDDTSIATSAFVKAAIDVAVSILAPASVGINNQTGTTYTLVLGDANTVVELDNASAITLTVPTNASVAFPVGTPVYLMQYGAGQVTVAAAGGVTIKTAASLTTRAQNSFLGLVKLGTNTWVLYGDMT